MNRAVLVCHCLLNPLTRAQGTKKLSRDIITVLIRKDIGIIQLPCPEITYGLPVDRPPRNKEDLDTPEYREHCRGIALTIINTVVSLDQDFTVFGLISVGGSPSCGFQRTHIRGEHSSEPGIFMEEFVSLFEEKGFKITVCDHELLEVESQREKFLL
ncbi:MAG: DUF523 domain-containing protein [Theionarchaea archaeon]|nr:DUF523 domain-containing protein [Theionarchaea archaeon]